MSEYMDIDGSVLEGGGQILRISISLSAILGIPVRVRNIRAGRSKPGLAAQHLKGIQLVAEMCQAKLTGASIGSTEIEFNPGKIKGGHYVADIHTAGSISLLLQVALPCALLADGPVSFELRGGTNADMAPQIDYMTEVFRPALRKFGADFNLTVHRRGYYPKGGGHVTVEVTPVKKFDAVNVIDRGSNIDVEGWCFVSGTLPLKLAYQMADGAKQRLRNVNIECYKEQREYSPDNCNGILIVSKYTSGCILASDGLGRRGLEPAQVGRMAGEDLAAAMHTGACFDQHAQDQIIIYMALAEGKSTVKVADVTLHTKTAIHVAELIAKAKFDIQPEGEVNLIQCTGIGFTSTYLNDN